MTTKSLSYLGIIAILMVFVLMAGCTQVQTKTPTTGPQTVGPSKPIQPQTQPTGQVLVKTTDNARAGSANYQTCVAKCGPGNAGNGEFCTDGCRAEEGARTKDIYWCDQLDNRPNVPSCYGTVAKTTGDLTLCNVFSGTDKDHCVAAFGSTSAG